jgi:hypothetical protein
VRSALLVLVPALACACACAPRGGDGSAASVALSADEMRARLVAADKSDGAEDGIISSCAPCGLGMKGHADHHVTAEGYTFHACSDACAKVLKDDPKSVIARLPAP